MKLLNVFALTLIFANAFSMEKADPAYIYLDSYNAQERSNGLKLIFQNRVEDLDHIKAVLFKENRLTYLGTLSKCLTAELFDFFKVGNFVYYYSIDKGPLLIIGTNRRPSDKDFAQMLIPADKLTEITDKETANVFQEAVTAAITKSKQHGNLFEELS